MSEELTGKRDNCLWNRKGSSWVEVKFAIEVKAMWTLLREKLGLFGEEMRFKEVDRNTQSGSFPCCSSRQTYSHREQGQSWWVGMYI